MGIAYIQQLRTSITAELFAVIRRGLFGLASTGCGAGFPACAAAFAASLACCFLMATATPSISFFNLLTSHIPTKLCMCRVYLRCFKIGTSSAGNVRMRPVEQSVGDGRGQAWLLAMHHSQNLPRNFVANGTGCSGYELRTCPACAMPNVTLARATSTLLPACRTERSFENVAPVTQTETAIASGIRDRRGQWTLTVARSTTIPLTDTVLTWNASTKVSKWFACGLAIE